MSVVPSSVAIEARSIIANGLDFYVASAGPIDGPMVMLLHGFPEFSYGWRHQIGALAAAGFRVIVPDQRGYGRSGKPHDVAAYKLPTLASDVVGIADQLGIRTFSLVGHDWGGIVAWRVASDYPGRLEKLAIINAPNLDVALSHILKSPLQLLKSYYVALFQIPCLPEWSLAALDFKMLTGALQASSRPGTFSADELAVYKDAWSQPRALTSMLDWYRALPSQERRKAARIKTPALVIWGDRDTALDPSLAEDNAALCDSSHVHHFADATHWIHHEHPERVNDLLVGFLT